MFEQLHEAGQELDDALEVRAVVAIYDEVQNEEINSWGTTSDAPFYKTMGSNYVNPRPVWGRHYKYRTTLIRVMVEKIEIGSWSSSLRSSCRRTEGGSVWLYRRVLD